MSLVNVSHLTTTFDDEFNTFTSSPDGSAGWMTTFAMPTLATQRSMPTEQQYYSDPSTGTNPFSVSNGVLDIQAAPTNPGSNPLGKPYTSGLITTYGDFSQEYGYFEIRAELPAGDGLFPAFWMLPRNGSDSAEIDIMENRGSSPTTLLNTALNHDVPIQSISTVTNLSQGFHTYGLEWGPTTITYYLDGAPVVTLPTPSGSNTAMYLLLNLAVGAPGSFEGGVDSSTVFPANYLIDYVHAYATADTVQVNGSAAVAAPVSVTPQLVGMFTAEASVDATGTAVFAAVKVVDTSSLTDTVTVTLSSMANGTLTNLSGWTVSGSTYTFVGSAAAATTALQGLVFLPGSAGTGTVATTFTVNVTNANGAAGAIPLVLSETHGTFAGSAQTIDGTLAPAGSGPLTVTDNGSANAFIGGTAGLNLTVNATGGDTIFTHAGSTNTIVLNTLNNTVESYGNDTITSPTTFYTTTEWVELKGAGNSVTYNGNLATVHMTGTNGTFTVNGNVSYIVTNGAQTINLNGQYNYAFGDAGLLTLTDTGSYSVITGAIGGLMATLTASDDTVKTMYGAADTILLNSGSANTIESAGNDTITIKSGGNTVTLTGTSTIKDLVGGNTIVLEGNDTLSAGGADTVTVSGGGTEVVTLTGASTVSGGGGLLSVTETGSGALVAAGYGTTNVVEGAGTGAVQFGTGATTVSGGTGADTYSFVSGNGGAQDTIYGFRASIDHVVFSGFTGSAVQTQTVVNGSLTAKLVDGTTILFSGVTNAGIAGPVYFYVNSGQTISGTVLNAADTAVVFAGGTALAATVSGGNAVVLSGTVSGSTIVAGGTEYLQAGSNAAATVSSGGVLTVSGGADSGATVLSSGAEFVFGGTVTSATVASGGVLTLIGGAVSGALVSGGALVQSGGVVASTTVEAGGSLTVSSGGTDSSTVVSAGGTEIILSGATALGAVVSSGGTQLMRAGSAEIGTRLLNGARLDLAALTYSSGGSASFNATSNTLTVTEGGMSATEMLSGSYAGDTFALSADSGGGTVVTVSVPAPHTPTYYYVNAGQTSSGIVLGNGDGEFVFSGGVANVTTVTSGGLLLVASGAASGTVIGTGGNAFLVAGTDSAAMVGSGGVLTVSGGVDTGATIGSGGVAYVMSGGTLAGATVSSGAVVGIVSGAVASNTALLAGGALDLTFLAYGTGSASFSSSTNVLTVTENGKSVTETLRGVSSGGGFAVSADSNGGTLVTATASPVMVSGPHVPTYTYVNSGQSVSGLVLSSGDGAFVYPGGSAAGTTVSSGGLLLNDGGVTSGGTVLGGGNVFVQLGTDKAMVVSSGGSLTVSGGVDSGAVVSSGGLAVVYGGALSGASVLGGGQLIEAGGTVSSASVFGSFTMSAGLDIGTVLGSGGMEFVGSGTVASGTTVSSGGVQVVMSGGTASGTQILAGGKLDLAGQPYAGASGFAFNSATDVLTFNEGGAAQSLTLRGGYAGLALQYGADSKGGLLISVVSS